MQKKQKKGKLSLQKSTVAILTLPEWENALVPTTGAPTGPGPTSGRPTCNHRQRLQQG
jgi:hypothetical protein